MDDTRRDRRATRRLLSVTCLLLAIGSAAPPHVAAYSVLAHESMVDSAWDDVIAPLLRRRYPQASAERVSGARAFAYGGSVIQDLGYYPFGSRLFTNLVHYVRSGDFVEALVRNAGDVDEFAFALGALAHYAADNNGHPVAVNRAVALMYPKLRSKFGDVVTYVDDPRRHVMVEFAFDVVQVASGAYLPDAYRSLVGFEVSTPLLERAFEEVYGLEIDDLFLNKDLAIGSYRYAISKTIPEMTRVAWKDKQDEIKRLMPTVQRNAFIYTITRRDYERMYGTSYRRPGILARVLVAIMKVVPKIGPFSAFAFKTPTAEAERLFADSFRLAREHYRRLLGEARDGRITLANTDFDTGQPAAWGEYALADQTYVELLDKLANRKFAGTPIELRQNIREFFTTLAAPVGDKKQRKRLTAVKEQLAALNAGS